MSGSLSARRLTEAASTNHGLVTRGAAGDLGVGVDGIRRLIQRGVLDEPVHGALVACGSVRTWRQQLAVAAAAIGGVPVASHRGAARLHRVDGCDEDLVEISVPRGHRVRLPGSVVHQLSTWFMPNELTVIDGIRCTALVRTLCDLASVVDPKRVERAVDDYQRRGRSLRALGATAERLHRPGQRGTNLILAEVKRRATGGRVRDSWFEKLVEECVRSPLIPELERQYTIRDAKGRIIARCDLAVPAVRLGLEAHSREFHTGPTHEAVDGRRDWKVAQVGWELKYLGWRDTEAPRTVRREIEAIVARRALDFGIDL